MTELNNAVSIFDMTHFACWDIVLKSTAALALVSGVGLRPAVAGTNKLVVTTMPGPRWEGALRVRVR